MTPEEEKKTRSQRTADEYGQAKQDIQNIGEQQANAIQGATQQYVDALNASQQAYQDAMAGYRTDWQNKMDASMGGVEAIIKEGEARLQREKEVANAEYLASQRAAQATGLTHLGSSIANLIAVGGFNASNQVYNNPSMDWMRKADQDRQIARQRMDNLRERQRQIQQHQLELQMNVANQAYGMDSALAGQGLEHGRGIANAGYQSARDIANVRAQAGMQATQTGLQGVAARNQVELQEASLGLQQQRIDAEKQRYEAQMRAQGLNPDGTINEQYVKDLQKYNTAKGGKNDDYISFRVNEYEDMPSMDWAGSSTWLTNTILSSIDTITDIPKEKKFQLDAILRDNTKKAQEKGELLKQFIGQSKQLRNLISRKSQEQEAAQEQPASNAGGYGSAADLDALLPKQ